MIFLVIAILAGLVSFACWIYVLIKIFTAGNIGLGVLGIICPLFAFIYGWVKSAEYNIQTVMLVWSAAIGVGIVGNVLAPHTTTQTTFTNGTTVTH